MPNRHSLIYVKSKVSPCSEHQEDELDFFNQWISNGFPLIYTRQFGEPLEENTIKLGLPYFDAQTNTKYRYSFSVKKPDVKFTAKLPGLKSIFPALVNEVLFDIGVYGSHAWQYLTGINYVQKTSDVDILIYYENQFSEEIITQLDLIRASYPHKKIDGEIRLPKFGDCQFQELINNTANELLFKTKNDVVLVSRDAINAEYPKLAIK